MMRHGKGRERGEIGQEREGLAVKTTVKTREPGNKCRATRGNTPPSPGKISTYLGIGHLSSARGHQNPTADTRRHTWCGLVGKCPYSEPRSEPTELPHTPIRPVGARCSPLDGRTLISSLVLLSPLQSSVFSVRAVCTRVRALARSGTSKIQPWWRPTPPRAGQRPRGSLGNSGDDRKAVGRCVSVCVS